MNFLSGGSKARVNKTPTPQSSLRIQSSVNGQPIAIVHGQQRIAGNLLWYGDFEAIAQTSTPPSSGKGVGGGGGGKGASGNSAYTYQAAVFFGLAEGPGDAVLGLWNNKTPDSLAALNFTALDGSQGQAAWGYLASNHPEAALGYSSLVVAAAGPLDLGNNAELPNLNWELRGAISGAVTEATAISSPFTYAAQYFSLACSVTEQAAIPSVSPYEIQAQNYSAPNALPVILGNISGATIPGSASSGVVDLAGNVFAQASSSPGPAQYSVNSSGLYTFNAANAGTPIIIIDLAIGPGVNYVQQPTANLTAGSAAITGLSSTTGIQQGQLVTGAGIPPGTVVNTLSGTGATLSQAATQSGGGVTLTFYGAALTQVLGSPGRGEFSLSVAAGAYGVYGLASADAGASVVITDVPDADPALSLTDFLANPRYGCGFPAAYLGNLGNLQNYAYASGLFVSPALTGAQAANDYLKDFSTGLNGEFVWSSGLLTFVPYGDQAISGNGRSYNPPSASIYSLTDDDFLPNAGTTGAGVSAFTSDDPVVCTRARPSDAYNNVKLEYLDRGNSYNPAIVEAKDDAAINVFGLRPADTKQLHFFCLEAAALTSAQLQLGRQQVRNRYSFTVPWYFILLDPMDVIAISDAQLGLATQWVRVLEITENQQDFSLSILAEEYLNGTGTAPLYGCQPKRGYAPNYNAPPPATNAPVIFAAPVQIATNNGLEIWMAVSGGAGWGGCDVYLSSDGDAYRNIGRILGPARQGVLKDSFPAGGDPDTADTLSVDLSQSQGTLLPGTTADADQAHTLCYVGGEFIAYSAATLTAQYQYNLGSYIRRGLYGSSVSSHAAGADFARLDAGIFRYPYSADQIGLTLYVKFTAFNLWGGGGQDLADIEPIAFTVPAPPPPANVTGFFAQQNGGAVVFMWNAVSDYALKGYDILYGPQDGSIGTADFLTEAAMGTEMTNASVEPGTWTFYCRARDIANQFSPTPATFNLVVVDESDVVIDDDEAADGWWGTKSGFVAHYTGVLVPDSTKLANAHTNAQLFEQYVPYPAATSIYTTPALDTGFNDTLRVWETIGTGLGRGQSGTVAPSFALDTWLTGAGDPAVFTPWSIGDVELRYLRGQVTFTNVAGSVGYLKDLQLVADRSPAIENSASAVTIAAGGTAITFPEEFHELPNVQVTVIGSTALTGTATSITTTGCTIHVFNSTSGADVGGTVNWTASGV